MKCLGIAPFQHEIGVTVSSVEGIVQQHKEVFSDGFGLFKGMSPKITVQDGARPRFFKPRPVPFALQDRVAEGLERLEGEGILSPVQSSEWAAPIAPVVKGDGRIRICGDFKVTVNPVIVVQKCPVPRVGELFAKLSGGVKFTKLDLKDAYQQIELDPESRKYVTISTQRGLYLYLRLPFSVSSAPALFQHEMENILRDLEHVVVYFDDILVTGANDEEHLKDLNVVLSRLEKAGLKLRLDMCKFSQPEVEYLGHIMSAEGLVQVLERWRQFSELHNHVT